MSGCNGTINNHTPRDIEVLNQKCAYCEKTGIELGFKRIIDFSQHIHDCKHGLIGPNPSDFVPGG